MATQVEFLSDLRPESFITTTRDEEIILSLSSVFSLFTGVACVPRLSSLVVTVRCNVLVGPSVISQLQVCNEYSARR